MFKVHAQLLRGTLHALWRMEDEALRDLQAVINTQGQPSQVRRLIMYVYTLHLFLSTVRGHSTIVFI